MMHNNNYSLTDEEFFTLNPQPSLLCCVYRHQMEPRPDPNVTKKMMQEMTSINPMGLTADEIDQAIAIIKAGEDNWPPTPPGTPTGASDLSEYMLSEEEMQSASDRLDQINEEALEQQKANTLLEEYFQNTSLYDMDLKVYFPILSDTGSEIPLTMRADAMA